MTFRCAEKRAVVCQNFLAYIPLETGCAPLVLRLLGALPWTKRGHLSTLPLTGEGEGRGERGKGAGACGRARRGLPRGAGAWVLIRMIS